MLNEEGCKLGRIFRSIAAGGRSQCNIVDLQLAQKEAQDLYNVCDYVFWMVMIPIYVSLLKRRAWDKWGLTNQNLCGFYVHVAFRN